MKFILIMTFLIPSTTPGHFYDTERLIVPNLDLLTCHTMLQQKLSERQGVGTCKAVYINRKER